MWASSEPLLQGKFIEAVSLLERSTAIRESAFGPAHPEVGASLNSLAVVLAGQVGGGKIQPFWDLPTKNAPDRFFREHHVWLCCQPMSPVINKGLATYNLQLVST